MKMSKVSTVLLVVVVAIVAGGGVYLWQKNDRYDDESARTGIVKEPSKEVKVSETQTYKNDDLGFSFEYSSDLGKVWENKSKGDGEVVGVTFINPDSVTTNGSLDEIHSYSAPKGGSLVLSSGLYGSLSAKTLRACDDILKNGFNDGDLMPSNCENLTVDNHSMRVVTFVAGGLSNSSHGSWKEVMFETKKGVWTFSSNQEDMYAELLKIVKTIKFS